MANAGFHGNFLRDTDSGLTVTIDMLHKMSMRIGVDAIQFGVSTEDKPGVSAQIQSYLNNGQGVHVFPAGKTFFLDDEIEWPENPIIYAAGATFTRATGATTDDVWYAFANFKIGEATATEYKGKGDVYWYGGTIDNMQMAIYHAENIHVEGLKFTRSLGHCIELNANKRATLCYLDLDDNVLLQSDNRNGDAINIDFAGADNFPGAGGGYDDTPCIDILIYRCRFGNVYNGVGSHKYIQPSNVRIRVIGNSFEGQVYNAVYGRWWIGAEIAGNKISGNQYQGVLLQQADRCHVHDNFFLDQEGESPIRVYDSVNCKVNDNYSYDTTGVARYTRSLHVQGGKRNSVETKGLMPGIDANNPVIFMQNSPQLTEIDGWVQLFSGDTTLTDGQSMTLNDSLSNYDQLQVMTQSSIVDNDLLRTFNLTSGFTAGETIRTRNGSLSVAGTGVNQLQNSSGGSMRIRRIFARRTSFASPIASVAA